jgi:hypothetical protein
MLFSMGGTTPAIGWSRQAAFLGFGFPRKVFQAILSRLKISGFQRLFMNPPMRGRGGQPS